MRNYLKIAFFFSIFGVFANAANIPVTIKGTTQTQIIINYTTTGAATSTCTITATDNNSGPPVADLSTATFTNANVDLSRTVANGYLWPTTTIGKNRTVVIGTHDQIKLGTDGKSYSTSLQTNSDHLITVSCNGGADSGTVHGVTQNVPYGSYYPETTIADSSQTTQGVSPTIDWADRTKKYIDPITGVLIQRISAPGDNYDDTNPVAIVSTTPVIDVNGAAWTNPNNFITNKVPGTLAVTSTIGAPLFAPFDTTFGPQGGDTWTDFRITPYGSASAGTVIATYCISENSGQSCANFTPIDVTYGVSASTYADIPSSYPSNFFSGWGGIQDWYGVWDLENRTFPGVSCSVSSCTLNTPASAFGFSLDRKTGSKFRISNCAVGSDTTLTVQSTDNWGKITTQEAALNLQNCTYRDMAAGIRVTLKNAGTLNVSMTGIGAEVRSGSAGSNGERYVGALSKVTDIAKDCDGNTRSPPTSGYLYGLSNQGIYLMQDDGRACLQSSLYNSSASVHLSGIASSNIPFISSKCFTLPDFQVPAHTWKVCHIANNYQEIISTYPPLSVNDNFTYTDLGAPASGIQAQVIAAGGPAATALASGLWPALTLDDAGDDGFGNGIVQYRSTSIGQDSECILAWADASNTLIATLPMWGNYPISYAACHFGGEVAAGYSAFSAEAENSQLSPIFFDNTKLLGGPFVTRSTEGMKTNGSFGVSSITISGCTKASPAVCTSTGNDLDNAPGVSGSMGALITISGATGAGWTAMNANLYAHKIDNNTFSLYKNSTGTIALDSTGFGTLGGTIIASMLPPLYSVLITSPTNVGGNAVLTGNLTGGYALWYPSGKLVMRDRDPITITTTTLDSTTQYYAKVTGFAGANFGVYTDSALTTPATFTSLSWVSNTFATRAEACPDPSTITLPGPLYYDSGFGTTGTGNQKIRCVTIRLKDQVCSDFAKTSEQGTYPCSSAPSDITRSALKTITVGDGFGDMSHIGNNHEILYVLKVTPVSTNQIDVTLLRSYADDPNYFWRGSANSIKNDYYAQQHSPGWTLIGQAPIPGGIVRISSPTAFVFPPVNGAHQEFVGGATPGNVSQVTGYSSGGSDPKVNVSTNTYAALSTTLHTSFPFFQQSTNAALTGYAQSYPSMRMLSGQAPTSEINSSYSWNSDWMAMNGSFGNGQNNEDGLSLTRTLTNIRGTAYDAGNTTTIVYKIPAMSTTVNTKIAPMFVTNWPHTMFTDISSTTTLITDANEGSYCVAYIAGECRPTSLVGDVFVAMRHYSDAYGQCLSNAATIGSPCAFGLSPHAGWAVQIRNVPLDIQNQGVRRLSLGWTPPLNHYSFSNWISSPDGKWGLFANNPLQQHPYRSNYSGSHWFAMKLPPAPTPDNKLRSGFVPIPVSVNGVSGDTVRVAFGYAENGDPNNLYCTSRDETCYTAANASVTNPFSFTVDASSYTACGSGCVVNVPAIPGRTLYYQVQRKNGSLVTSGQTEIVTVP